MGWRRDGTRNHSTYNQRDNKLHKGDKEMSKKYHLDQNEVAFLHCINSAFAGIAYGIDIAGDGKRIPKKKLIKAIKETLAQANVALCSEFIRGELIKKGVLENGDNTALCTFDPSVDNDDKAETEVFTQEELDKIRFDTHYKNSVKGS